MLDISDQDPTAWFFGFKTTGGILAPGTLSLGPKNGQAIVLQGPIRNSGIRTVILVHKGPVCELKRGTCPSSSTASWGRLSGC